ncbi:hypothetical protein PAAG_11875 [Paracoccidioides lutzii Pb01]|uniref:Uncharacterized protein n=1 Tax=Paracoccidioides lutzii (strain ATCC MYA-826 / Pb01) TaxID=502779 RepID=A0A0A2V0R8_PARBA|nr:hypothetical protein PAAG_11875 [Paracoccidioides lutzii Pb01]KGQ01411.1 hypothetical protein PAAG_11875 [Paracoccidioides lutzii Pb01]
MGKMFYNVGMLATSEGLGKSFVEEAYRFSHGDFAIEAANELVDSLDKPKLAGCLSNRFVKKLLSPMLPKTLLSLLQQKLEAVGIAVRPEADQKKVLTHISR